MTEEGRPDLDALADLDAGLLDPRRAAEVQADPRAAAALDALAATRAELAALPDVPVPPEVAARWKAALRGAARDGTAPAGAARKPDAAEQPAEHRPERPAGSPPVGDGNAQPQRPDGRAVPFAPGPATRRPGTRPDPTRARPTGAGHPATPGTPPSRRPRRPRPALVGALLLAVVAGAGLLWPRAEPPPSIDTATLAAIGRDALGIFDAGALADPARRAGCLVAVAPPGVESDAPLVGARSVDLSGRPGVLLVLATGRRGEFAVVVVDPGCGPDGGALLGLTTVGG